MKVPFRAVTHGRVFTWAAHGPGVRSSVPVRGAGKVTGLSDVERGGRSPWLNMLVQLSCYVVAEESELLSHDCT